MIHSWILILILQYQNHSHLVNICQRWTFTFLVIEIVNQGCFYLLNICLNNGYFRESTMNFNLYGIDTYKRNVKNKILRLMDAKVVQAQTITRAPLYCLFSLKHSAIRNSQTNFHMRAHWFRFQSPSSESTLNRFIRNSNALLYTAYYLFYRCSYLSLHTMNTWVLRYIF